MFNTDRYRNREIMKQKVEKLREKQEDIQRYKN